MQAFNGSFQQVNDANQKTFPVMASVVPGAGTWNVGYCASASRTITVDLPQSVGGWVQVVNE
jgi:hypothetical protein